jgi:hypothetical protein
MKRGFRETSIFHWALCLNSLFFSLLYSLIRYIQANNSKCQVPFKAPKKHIYAPQLVPTTPQLVPTTPQLVPTTPQLVPTTPQLVPFKEHS